MITPGTTGRQELGAFLRAHRERLTPAEMGIEPGPRRRTPGLRREELASLAGVSGTWIAWIEQGRDVSVSAAALHRLARTMRLSAPERHYLFELAGRRDPEAAPEPAGDALAAELERLLATFATPAYALDRSWTALAWNAPATRLFVGWLDRGAERNLLRYVFLDPLARDLIADWDSRALRLAAEFRADYGRHLAAADTRAFVDRLLAESPVFARAWQAHEVTEREGGERRFTHPLDGPLRYRQATLLLARQPDVKIV
ncbi:MAG TPA: helix-turn-helix transcriptional regulator, partial [Devosia sp.]|nr:helix-turn-helix transcriptional regulator [Devosia sp.]